VAAQPAIGTEAPDTAATPRAAGGADESAAVLRRLERIEELDRERAPAGQLLGELRELVREAEAWARSGQPGASGEAASGRSAASSGGDATKVRGEAEGMR
jgi:hypothetical protein